MPRRQAAELQHVRTAIKLQPEEARAEAAEGNPAAQHPSEQLDGEAAATASTAADDTAKAAEREHAASDDVQEPAAAGGVPGTADTSDEFECKRMLWMAGLQAKAADGSEAHYITSSASYLRYYASALRSARENAPSLLPVLVVLNSMPQEFVDWVEAQGALVIRHELSFAHRMEAINDPWLRDNLTKQLMASYARLDVPAIMEKVIPALPAYERRWQELDSGAAARAAPRGIDLETVMWTDPDVLFRHDIDSCSLPKPRLLSIGPEDLVEQFFKTKAASGFRQPWHRLTALPDAYNYKAYWGEPEAGWMSMFTHQVGDVAIVHTHGPKPELSLCVIEYLQRNVKKRLGWEPKHVLHRKNDIVQECGVQVAMYLDELLQIMAGAFKADEGAMYRWVLREHNRLCPDTCWLPGKGADEPQ
ncbi:hypothetical protein COHA_000149 [Chlorella ohadii]|uniref:Uncharacterized protein n=1 Tax=Chlorella ohadii TaxID=2649997 RepID=A0AAD5DZ76_9CHLO|nr:hypothetical protein COHA_000149 [Chlorella ohadii]